jgi:Cft2 family RNA processing exonuclease
VAFHSAGHVLGSAQVAVEYNGRKIVASRAVTAKSATRSNDADIVLNSLGDSDGWKH